MAEERYKTELGENFAPGFSGDIEKFFLLLEPKEESTLDWLLDLFEKDQLSGLHSVARLIGQMMKGKLIIIELLLEKWLPEAGLLPADVDSEIKSDGNQSLTFKEIIELLQKRLDAKLKKVDAKLQGKLLELFKEVLQF